MDQKTILRVGIIGCGRIGSLWDENSAVTETALTHAKAYVLNPATRLEMVCDLQPERASTAAKFWKVPTPTTSAAEIAEAQLDIVSLCTPVQQHLELVRLFSEKSPGTFLIIEKPLATSLGDALQITNLCKALRHEPLLNYSRRFTPGIQNLRDQIFDNKYGALQSANAYYGNGFLNNGSHMLDLITYLLGQSVGFHVLGETPDDRIGQDSTLSFSLKMATGVPVTVHGLDHRNYTVFELDMMFEKARVRLIDRAMTIETSTIIKDPTYDGYYILVAPQSEPTRYEQSLSRAVQEAVDVVRGHRQTPSCTPEQVVQLTQLMENMLRSFSK